MGTSSSPGSGAGARLGSPSETTIPALVDDALDQAGSLELALIENIVREDLSPIEQARTFSVLLDDLRMTSVGPRQTNRTQPRRHREHDASARPARRGRRDDRRRRPHEGSRQGPAHRARPPPPPRARAPGGGARLVGSRARGGDRSGRETTRYAVIAGRRSVRRRVPARGGDHTSDRMRGHAPSPTGAASRSCSTTPPPIVSLARSAPTWEHCECRVRSVVGTRSTWNTGGRWSCAKSCAKSCTPCRTSGGPRPRQHWGFEASVIPTTRPPRGRSGSRDHTLAQLGQAGAGATRAVPQTVSCNQIWSSRVRRNKGNYRNTTTTLDEGSWR